MTTIVNSPTPSGDSNGGSSMLIGVVVLIGFVLILLYFGLPVLRNMQPAQINLPAPQIVLPDKIDVNVTQPK
jgi:hypothetical protein